jgi:hypothetical protein
VERNVKTRSYQVIFYFGLHKTSISMWHSHDSTVHMLQLVASWWTKKNCQFYGLRRLFSKAWANSSCTMSIKETNSSFIVSFCPDYKARHEERQPFFTRRRQNLKSHVAWSLPWCYSVALGEYQNTVSSRIPTSWVYIIIHFIRRYNCENHTREQDRLDTD